MKKSIVPTDTSKYKQYKEYIGHKYGMKPENAALKVGYDRSKAKLLAGIEKAKEYMSIETIDIAEREGITVTKLIQHLIDKAGLGKGQGATKIINSNAGWEEVEDDSTQLKFLQELFDLLKLKHKKDAHEDTDRIININIRPVQEKLPAPVPIEVEVE